MIWRGVLIFTVLAATLRGEHLPVRNYSTVDGLLADSPVFDISQDSRGYLWLSQPEGVSRFDGLNFRTYGVADGLPAKAEINQVLPATGGAYWLATEEGLVRYDPSSGGKLFTPYRVKGDQYANLVYQIAEDQKGGLWLATFDGLYHASLSGKNLETTLVLRPEAPPGTEPKGQYPILNVIQDHEGIVWAIGHYCGLYRRGPGGNVSHYTAKDGLPALTAGHLFEDSHGRIWLASAKGLFLLNSHPSPGKPLVMRRVDTTLAHPENAVRGIAETQDGHLWLATAAGLLEFDGTAVRAYTQSQGLPANSLTSVYSDGTGDLWVGSDSGLSCVRRSGLTSFTGADGINSETVAGLYRSKAGEIAAVTHPADLYTIHLWDGARFHPVRPPFPREITRFGWGTGDVILQDREGDWWVSTYEGLCRFSRGESIQRLSHGVLKKRYTTADGLPSNNIYSVYEDRHGNVWIGCMFPPDFGLARWNRSTDKIEDISRVPGIVGGRAARSFAEDHAGNVWVGFLEGGLARFRHERFDSILSKETVSSLAEDQRGVLWAATTRGILRVENPAQDQPSLSWLTQKDGLSTDEVLSVLPWGNDRLFAGTGKGLDQLDLQSKLVTHFHRSDGLAGERVTLLKQDGKGQIWGATPTGLSMLKPKQTPALSPPAVWISEVRVGSLNRPLSDLGESSVSLHDLSAKENDVQISVVGTSTAPGRRPELLYRYRMSGTGEIWSAPTREQTVTYASLTPGQYTFQVSVQDVRGQASTQAASVHFTILPPFWKRWWFIGIEVLAAVTLTGVLYRIRMEQVLKIERVRERIAKDLHDEVGSSLTQIAILLEVSGRSEGERPERESVGRAAAVARQATASMGDIVWAINPNRDSLDDLTVRIRRYAGDVLGGVGIDCVVSCSGMGDQKLDSEIRRQLLLITKEAVHNAARHSLAQSVKISLAVGGGFVTLKVEDDGVGFEIGAKPDGQGHESITNRARKMGGQLAIRSRLGAGVVIECRLPVKSPSLRHS